MPKAKTLYLILFLLLLVIVVIFTLFIKKTPPQLFKENPIKIITTTPTITQLSDFKITRIDIPPQPIDLVQLITIQFNQPLFVDNLKIQINPVEEVEYTFDPSSTILTIKPKNAWNFSTTYIVKILPTTTSQDGKQLNQEYTITFKTIQFDGI